MPEWLEAYMRLIRGNTGPGPEVTERDLSREEINRQSREASAYLQNPDARPEVARTSRLVEMARAVPTQRMELPTATPELQRSHMARRRLEETARRRADSAGEFVGPSQTFRISPRATAEVGVLARGQPRPVTDADVDRLLNQGVSREMGALLDTIAWAEGTEGLPSGGYGSIYGDTPQGDGSLRFTDYSRHPAQFFAGPDGLTSAAGRFQIVNKTYRQIADRLGITDFSPESQNRLAAFLALDAYGPNLERDLQDPSKHEAIARALSPVWASLPFHPTQRRTSVGDFTRVLQERLANRIQASPRTAIEFASPRSTMPRAGPRQPESFFLPRRQEAR